MTPNSGVGLTKSRNGETLNMNANLELVLGIGIGAFVSWIITHEYYRKSATAPELLSISLIISKDIETVWSVITDADNVRKLDWRGPQIILGGSLRIGTELGCAPTGYGISRKLFVVELNRPYRLSWGSNPSEWDTEISLAERPDGTRLIFTRKFWHSIDPWWDAILNLVFRNFQEMDAEALLKDDIHRISRLFSGSV